MKYDREYFSGKTAVVTGAASGIGLALTEELLENGAAKVVMADINQARLSEHENRLSRQYAGKVKGILCDVSVEEQVRRMIAAAAEFFGDSFDLLFNNAGATFLGWFEDKDIADWEAAFALNFYGALYGVRAVLPIMRKQGGGQIVNIISGMAFSPLAEYVCYASSKAALNAMTMVLRTEYWDDNIKISAATPGTTRTDIWGDRETPASAQTPQQSACRILRGVAKNERVTYGDDADARGAKNNYNHLKQNGVDQYFLRVARERRKGKSAI